MGFDYSALRTDQALAWITDQTGILARPLRECGMASNPRWFWALPAKESAVERPWDSISLLAALTQEGRLLPRVTTEMKSSWRTC